MKPRCFMWKDGDLIAKGPPFDGRDAVQVAGDIEDAEALKIRPHPTKPNAPMRGGGYRNGRKLRPDQRPRALRRFAAAMRGYEAERREWEEGERRAMLAHTRILTYVGTRYADPTGAIRAVVYTLPSERDSAAIARALTEHWRL